MTQLEQSDFKLHHYPKIAYGGQPLDDSDTVVFLKVPPFAKSAKSGKRHFILRTISSSHCPRTGLFGNSADKESEGESMTRILMVDDSKFLRLATERALARAGYEVFSASDGEHALQAALEKHPDVILLDMLLPGMGGPEVLKELKKNKATAAIPVVVLTGLSHKNAERLQKDGAFAFLEKSELGLDQGCESLLVELTKIVKLLHLKTPAPIGQAAGI
jgi:CheY-like chemotaxis protein